MTRTLKPLLCLATLAALAGGSARADSFGVHATGLLPGLGASYEWGNVDTGATRISASTTLIFGVTVQADYLQGFGPGSPFYWGAGVGGTLSIFLGAYGQAQAFVGAQSAGPVSVFAEGGALASTVPFSATSGPGGRRANHVMPYVRAGLKFLR